MDDCRPDRAPAPVLVYCAGDGRRFAEIAVAAGFAYGVRSDMRPHHPVQMADLNWRKPDLDAHAAFVAEHRPALAVAPDLLTRDDLVPALRYAERLAEHAARVIVVPKYAGAVADIPREPWIVLGYSVPTRYGGADAQLLWEWSGWPVHLLGGSPQAQLTLAYYLNVVSLDGNSHQRAARRGVWWCSTRRGWRTRDPAVPLGPDLPYRAFARSCAEIRAAWGLERNDGKTVAQVATGAALITLAMEG